MGAQRAGDMPTVTALEALVAMLGFEPGRVGSHRVWWALLSWDQ